MAMSGLAPLRCLRVEAFDDDVRIRIDANLGGNGHGLAGDGFGVERLVDQGARGGKRIVAAGADPGDGVFGFQHVAGACQDEGRCGIGDDHHGFQAAQEAVSAPVFRQFDGGTGQLAGVLLKLGLEPLEQGEGVGRRAREAANHVAFAQAADLFGIRLDDRLAEADLAVTGNYNFTALPDRQDRRGVPARKAGILALVRHMYGVS
ncbi:protein of unknown function [Hyphomicrobium sp. MC1]|nr:protein of unknown function [Hyphomicrobium sp. MC1]